MWIKLTECQLSWKNMINLTGCQLSWQDVNQPDRMSIKLTGCQYCWQAVNQSDRMWIKLTWFESSWPKVNLAAVWSEYSWLDAYLAYRKKIQLTMKRRIQLQIHLIRCESGWLEMDQADHQESGRFEVSLANRTPIQLTGSGQYGKVFSWKQFEEVLKWGMWGAVLNIQPVLIR